MARRTETITILQFRGKLRLVPTPIAKAMCAGEGGSPVRFFDSAPAASVAEIIYRRIDEEKAKLYPKFQFVRFVVARDQMELAGGWHKNRNTPRYLVIKDGFPTSTQARQWMEQYKFRTNLTVDGRTGVRAVNSSFVVRGVTSTGKYITLPSYK